MCVCVFARACGCVCIQHTSTFRAHLVYVQSHQLKFTFSSVLKESQHILLKTCSDCCRGNLAHAGLFLESDTVDNGICHSL